MGLEYIYPPIKLRDFVPTDSTDDEVLRLLLENGQSLFVRAFKDTSKDGVSYALCEEFVPVNVVAALATNHDGDRPLDNVTIIVMNVAVGYKVWLRPTCGPTYGFSSESTLANITICGRRDAYRDEVSIAPE